MSQQFSTPLNYPAVAMPQLDIPASLLSADLKKLQGATSSSRSVPSSSGAVGPSSSMLFNIPTQGNSYLKSGSVYLRFRLTVAQVNGAGVTWKFKGQTGVTDYGGASAIIDRVVASCGGVQLSTIQNYNHYRNQVVLHATSPDFILNDLNQLEYAGAVKTNTTANSLNTTAYVCVPLLLPCFNASNDLPLFLLKSPITVEITSATVGQAFTTATTDITNYTIDEAAICYKTIDVDESYKNAMVERLISSNGIYSMELNDVYALNVGSQQVLDYNVGLSLSSLKGVLITEALTAKLNTSLATELHYETNGLSDLRVYINNKLLNNIIIDNDVVAFAEMNKALSRLYDYNTSSWIGPTSYVVADAANVRNAYTTRSFLTGVDASTVSDYNFSISGVPCQQLSVHIEHTNASVALKWQNSGAYTSAASIFMFILFDSVLMISGDGSVSVRR